MADDNLIQAGLGVLEGFYSAYQPYVKSRYEDQLAEKKRKQELQNNLILQQYKNTNELDQERVKIGMREDSERRLYDQKMENSPDYVSGQDIKTIYPDISVDVNRKYNKALLPGLSIREKEEGKDDNRDKLRDERRDKLVLQYSERMLNNPIIKEMNKQNISLDSVNEMADLARKGNTVSSSAMGIKAARAMGEVGVLTETDISRYVRSGQLNRKAADTLSSWTQGKPTQATLQEISQIMTVLKNLHNEKIQPEYDSYVNRLSRNLGIPPEEAAYLMDVKYGGTSKNKSSIGVSTKENLQNTSADYQSMSDEELLRALGQ